MNVDPRAFRNALGAFATGVVIVTARTPKGVDVGMTASSFNSVSLDPPMVLWSLGRLSTHFEAFRQARYFVIHVLGEDQQELSTRFAAKGIDRFSGLEFNRREDGTALLEGCAARFECRNAYQYAGGDHLIMVGEVLHFEHRQAPPLIFHGGRYLQSAISSVVS